MNLRTLFIKPPDPFLQQEFIYQQLAPHYLQAWLDHHRYPSDVMVMYVADGKDGRRAAPDGLQDCNMILVVDGQVTHDGPFDPTALAEYDLVALSVMTPQAEYASWLNRAVRSHNPSAKIMLGGSHARYYLDEVLKRTGEDACDYVVPQDGWQPLLEVLERGLPDLGSNHLMSHQQDLGLITMPPTRPLGLMSRYSYEIAGLPAFHTVTALGCPFTCNFCEAGGERTRFFPAAMIDADLATMAEAHRRLGREHFAVMFLMMWVC